MDKTKKYINSILFILIFVFCLPGVFAKIIDKQKNIENQQSNFAVDQSTNSKHRPIDWEKKLTPLIENAMKDWNVPGAAIVIVNADGIIFQKNLGTKTVNKNDPITPDTIFQAASVTKNISALMLMILEQEGKISLDDKVIKHLPEFQLSDKDLAQTMTIKDLASHNNRFSSFSGDNLCYLALPQNHIIEKLKHYPIKYPDPKFSYQNVFFGLIGVILERLQPNLLCDLYNKKIFKPLNMNHAYLFDDRSLKQPSKKGISTLWIKIKNLFNRAPSHKEQMTTSHDRLNGAARAIDYNQFGFTFTSTSGLHLTVNDFAKWLQFYLNSINGRAQPQLLSPEKFHELISPHVDVKTSGQGTLFPANRVSKVSYGLGVYQHDYNGITVYSHMGGMRGSRSIFAIVPDKNIAIGILSNLGGMRESFFPEAIRNYFLDLVTGEKNQIDWSKHEKNNFDKIRKDYQENRTIEKIKNLSPPKDSVVYEGAYYNELFGTVIIKRNSNKRAGDLIMVYKAYPDAVEKVIELSHWNGDEFQFAAEKMGPGFSADYKGELYFFPKSADTPTQMFGLYINFLFEGENPIFIKR